MNPSALTSQYGSSARKSFEAGCGPKILIKLMTANASLGPVPVSQSRVHGKVTLITGAGSGIGRAAAILLARHGATVVVRDLDGSAAEKVAAVFGQHGRIATSTPLDVSQETEWQRLVDAVLSAHQRLDVTMEGKVLS